MCFRFLLLETQCMRSIRGDPQALGMCKSYLVELTSPYLTISYFDLAKFLIFELIKHEDKFLRENVASYIYKEPK